MYENILLCIEHNVVRLLAKIYEEFANPGGKKKVTLLVEMALKNLVASIKGVTWFT